MGRVVQVIGPVVDVAFDSAELPEINTALLLTNKAIPVIAGAAGITLKQPGGNQDYEYLRDLTKGGLYVFMGMFLWNARSHLKSVFRRAMFGDKQVKREELARLLLFGNHDRL